jgi:WD40 repeat protein
MLHDSGGIEREISIWNPYSSQRAVATLRGHASSIVQLACDDANFQLISLASDNTLKVWDIRNHQCVQTFVAQEHRAIHHQYPRFSTDIDSSTSHTISALIFDPNMPGLISGTTYLSRWPLKMKKAQETGTMNTIGKTTIRLCRYNSVFHQVLTADMSDEGVVKTWSVRNIDFDIDLLIYLYVCVGVCGCVWVSCYRWKRSILYRYIYIYIYIYI